MSVEDDLREIEVKLNNELRGLFNSRLMMKLGKMARDIVYKRVKSGYGVDSDKLPDGEAVRQRLAPLSESYKNKRKGLARFQTKSGEVRFKIKAPTLGEFGTVGKSNLTLTGQMLDSIQLTLQRQGFLLSIPPTPRDDSNLTNEEVAKFVTEQGRPFFALTGAELQILIREVELELRKISAKI